MVVLRLNAVRITSIREFSNFVVWNAVGLNDALVAFFILISHWGAIS